MEAPVVPSRQTRATAHDSQLTVQEAARYRRIFELQDAGDWDAADRLVGQVTDMRLIGHVEYQRLMHPSYKATYHELRGWLERFADHAGADKVYQLALRRMARGERKPPAPRGVAASLPAGQNGAYASDRGLQAAVPRRGEAVQAPIQAAKAAGDGPVLPAGAVTVAASAAVAAPPKPEPASPASGAGSWSAGIAAWRIGQDDKAARHFQAFAQSDSASPWDRSAGAYWAARAHQRARRADEAARWLGEAAKHPRTFYGLIARQALGNISDAGLRVPILTRRHVRVLAEHPAGRRAIALVQAGRRESAEQELRRIEARGNATLEEALVALADMAGMPSLAMRLGSVLTDSDGTAYDSALYPLPPWEPRGGFTVDRALLFALMRQESRFEPDARSGAGARGLMQLMPNTASYVADKLTPDILDSIQLNSPRGKPDLYEPEVNLTLGQHYVRYLMDQKGIGDNLILTVAAYNAGPGNLQRWRRRLSRIKDPLLFIESLPVRETRTFVEQVLTNYWIYSQRLGRPLPSLEAIAGGRWPVYMAVDGEVPTPKAVQQVASDGKD
ncbi:lytic transglycosylase domain-containing protein [Skermanella mucosa]|uniref:lytic transglycosylase domain-containing protein n=1 Tax=Skermanella mucosa TaxID=1789672 RepID=UPI00192C9E42|nr:lytic transglycosylase domain-containing protein [Skermanella mucosa]UEM22808.1 lytic transglycosylase domain-containing protein [Skermanella mucosa]